MTKREIANKYINFLSDGDTKNIEQLFAKDGKVQSPINGEKSAPDFYKELSEDTISCSQLKEKSINISTSVRRSPDKVY